MQRAFSCLGLGAVLAAAQLANGQQIGIEGFQHSVAGEFAGFDGFQFAVRQTLYKVDKTSGDSWLDRSRWTRFSHATAEFQYRVTRDGGHTLVEFLNDDAAKGYAPLDISVSSGGLVVRYGKLDGMGRTVFDIIPGQIQESIFGWSPLLQVFGLKIQDYPGDAKQLLQTAAQRGRLDGNALTWDYSEANREYEVTVRVSRGSLDQLLLRFRDCSGNVVEWDHRVLSRQTIGGTSLPSEVAIVIRNDSVNAGYSTLHHFQLCAAGKVDPGSSEILRVVPERCSSVLRTYDPNGGVSAEVFDANGVLIDRSFSAAEPANPALVDRTASTEQGFRKAIPIAAAASGAVSVLVLLSLHRLISWRSRDR